MQFTQKSRSSLPLDRADGLGREVVTHAADTGNLGGDAEVGHHGEVLPDGKTGPVDLLADDCVGLAQHLEAVAGNGAEAANAQASRGAAVCSMAPAVSLEQWPCTVESSGSARQQSRPSSLRTRTGHGSTRSLEMNGGLSSIFHRVAVFESFRKQSRSNDARLSATHSYMNDLPPLVWT